MFLDELPQDKLKAWRLVHVEHGAKGGALNLYSALALDRWPVLFVWPGVIGGGYLNRSGSTQQSIEETE